MNQNDEVKSKAFYGRIQNPGTTNFSPSAFYLLPSAFSKQKFKH